MFHYISTKTMIGLCLTVNLFILAQVTHNYAVLVLGFTMLVFSTVEGITAIYKEHKFHARLQKIAENKS